MGDGEGRAAGDGVGAPTLGEFMGEVVGDMVGRPVGAGVRECGR